MEAIFGKILAWIMSQQGIITIVVTALLGFFTKKFPREKLFAITLKPVALIVAFAINTFLLKVFPRKLASAVEEGPVCSLIYICREFFNLLEVKILEDNAIEVKSSPLPKAEASKILSNERTKIKIEKETAKIKANHKTRFDERGI